MRGVSPSGRLVAFDVARAAEIEGLTCQAFASEALWRAECSLGPPEERFRGAFARLRQLLAACEPDGPVAGLLRGVSPNGRLVVFDVPRGEAHAPLLAVVLTSPLPLGRRIPCLWLSALSERDDARDLALVGLGGPGAAL